MNQRKFLIIILLLIIASLVGLGIFISYRIQQENLAPSESHAAVTLCGGYALPGSTHCNTWECTQYLCDPKGTGNWINQGKGGVCSSFSSCQPSAPAPRCGDGACNGNEACTGAGGKEACPQDCSGGAGECGGGPTGDVTTDPTVNCTPGVIYCAKDYPNIGCSATNSQGVPLGKKCLSNGSFTSTDGRLTNAAVCTGYDACGPVQTQGGNCTGKVKLSTGYDATSSGGFVGCSGQLDCYCGSGSTSDANPVGHVYTSADGSIHCVEDTGDPSCRSTIGTNTSVPTTPTPPPPPPPSATPYCGDATCQSGELCERTSSGASTYKACTTTGGAPSGATVSACYGVQFNQPVATATCKYCGDGVFTSGQEQCDASAPAGGGNNPSQCNSDCTLKQTANQCVSLVESAGSDPVSAGVGNFVDYTLTYDNTSSTNPYPNIKLVIGTTSSSPVGRDANVASSALVTPIPSGGVTHDAVANTWTYKFRWEAASTTGTAVANGTYNVRVLLDGTTATEVTTPTGCTETIQVSSTAQQSPLFDIVKKSAPVCASNGDQVINYTITVTNVGAVSGVIDFVNDTLDPAVVSLGVTPTSIVPSFGTYASGVITWTGTTSDRTFAAGQAKQYTYSIRISKNQLINFVSSGVKNHAQVQYDTPTTNNDTASFDLRTMLNCSINGIPVTGILDDPRFFLIGLMFMVMGYIAYKYQIGRNLSESLLLDMGKKFTSLQFSSFENSMMEDMEKKIRKKKK